MKTEAGISASNFCNRENLLLKMPASPEVQMTQAELTAE